MSYFRLGASDSYLKYDSILLSENVQEDMALFDRPPIPTWGYQETKNRITALPSSKMKYFISIGYLTGGRISEIWDVKASDITREDDVLSIKIPTLKRRKQMHRDLFNEIGQEKPYCAAALYFKKYVMESDEGDVKFGRWLGISQRSVERKMLQLMGCVPHSLRHLRATHMGKSKIPGIIHKPSPSYLKYYFGWSKITTAIHYIDDLTADDIKENYQKDKEYIG